MPNEKPVDSIPGEEEAKTEKKPRSRKKTPPTEATDTQTTDAQSLPTEETPKKKTTRRKKSTDTPEADSEAPEEQVKKPRASRTKKAAPSEEEAAKPKRSRKKAAEDTPQAEAVEESPKPKRSRKKAEPEDATQSEDSAAPKKPSRSRKRKEPEDQLSLLNEQTPSEEAEESPKPKRSRAKSKKAQEPAPEPQPLPQEQSDSLSGAAPTDQETPTEPEQPSHDTASDQDQETPTTPSETSKPEQPSQDKASDQDQETPPEPEQLSHDTASDQTAPIDQETKTEQPTPHKQSRAQQSESDIPQENRESATESAEKAPSELFQEPSHTTIAEDAQPQPSAFEEHNEDAFEGFDDFFQNAGSNAFEDPALANDDVPLEEEGDVAFEELNGYEENKTEATPWVPFADKTETKESPEPHDVPTPQPIVPEPSQKETVAEDARTHLPLELLAPSTKVMQGENFSALYYPANELTSLEDTPVHEQTPPQAAPEALERNQEPEEILDITPEAPKRHPKRPHKTRNRVQEDRLDGNEEAENEARFEAQEEPDVESHSEEDMRNLGGASERIDAEYFDVEEFDLLEDDADSFYQPHKPKRRELIREQQQPQVAPPQPQPQPQPAPRKANRKMFFSVLAGERIEVALSQEGKLCEYYLDMQHQKKLKGNIYKGIIQNIDTNLQAAFVNYGTAKNGFLQIDEIHSEYWLAHHEPTKGNKFPPIQKVIKPGQEVLVQVVKEPTGNKGSFLTTWLSLAGRFLVLTPGQEQIGVSRKVVDEAERARLKELIAGIDPGEGIGVIVRTVSEGTTKLTLKNDLQYLKRIWRDIRKRATEVTAPALIYTEPNLIERAVRDYLTEDVAEIWVDDEEVAETVRDMVSLLFPHKKDLVHLFTDKRQSLWDRFNLRRQIEQVYAREVFLPSGGRLVFDQTEALMAIDVNSGKISCKGNFETMAYKTNMEAAESIARQLRLRDVGGQVVIDFIEMRERKHVEDVERHLRMAMKADRARYDVEHMSSFGLLELVRQRTGFSALSITQEPCPYCAGTGQRRNLEWQSLQVASEIQRQMRLTRSPHCVYETSPELGMYLLNHKREMLQELERMFGKTIEITIHRSLHP